MYKKEHDLVIKFDKCGNETYNYGRSYSDMYMEKECAKISY